MSPRHWCEALEVRCDGKAARCVRYRVVRTPSSPRWSGHGFGAPGASIIRSGATLDGCRVGNCNTVRIFIIIYKQLFQLSTVSSFLRRLPFFYIWSSTRLSPFSQLRPQRKHRRNARDPHRPRRHRDPPASIDFLPAGGSAVGRGGGWLLQQLLLLSTRRTRFLPLASRSVLLATAPE